MDDRSTSGGPGQQPAGARVRVDRASMVERLSDLNSACRGIAGAETLEELLTVVTEASQSLIGTHQAVTSRLLHGWSDARTYVSLSDKYAEWRDYDEPPKGLGVLEYVVRENRSLRLTAEELPHHPDWRGLRDAPGHPPLPDYLAAPLISRDGRNIGLIQLADKVDGSKFTEDDEVLLIQVAQMASATLEHVELLEREREMRAELEERGREARLAAQVGFALTGRRALDDKLQECTQAMVAHLDAAFARIWLLDESSDTLLLRASAGLYTHLDGDHARVPVGSFKIGRIAANRQPHLSNDVPNDPEVSDREWAREEGMVSFAGYPLQIEGRCIGVMAMFARRELPRTTLDALGAVADSIAVGIEQSRDAEQLRTRAAQLRGLAVAASEINSAAGIDEVLEIVTREARAIIGAHQAITSMTKGPDWAQAITAVSLSDRYAAWRDYDEPPDGSGIYAWVAETQHPVRMTQTELESHPRWRGFGRHAETHPPMRGWLAAPLTAPDGSNFGLLQLSDRFEGEFTDEDMSVLVQLAEIASSALHKASLYEERARVAHALQASLLPPSLPAIPGVDLAACYIAGTEDVGGDFYDVFPLRGQSWGVVLGDVRGKGPDAAALTALARHSTRTAAMLQRRPRKVLEVVNEALRNTEDEERFCSAVFLRLSTSSKGVTVQLASGGHPPVLVGRGDGSVERYGPTGPLIGLFDDIEVSDRSTLLAPGDVLIAYTDGITEARRGAELFGEERLERLLADHAGDDADAIAQAVVDAAQGFSDEAEADDAAVVVLRVQDGRD